MNNVHELLLTALCVEAVCVEEPLQGCRAAGLQGSAVCHCGSAEEKELSP